MIESVAAPGWWLASDGNWYPPELHPDVAQHRPPTPTRHNHLVELELDLRGPHPTLREIALPVSQVVVAPPAAVRVATPSIEVRTETPTVESPAEPFGELARVPAPAPVEPRRAEPAPPRPARARRGKSSPRRRAVKTALSIGALSAAVVVARTARPERGTLADQTTPLAATEVAAPAATAVITGTADQTPTAGVSTTAAAAAGNGARLVSVLDVAKGSCLDQPDLSTGLLSLVKVVPCNQPHTHEVYYDVRYTQSGNFDAAALSKFANDRCVGEFKGYVGVDYEVSRYQYLIIVPTLETWTRDGDRNVLCVAFEDKATLTASIAGTKR